MDDFYRLGHDLDVAGSPGESDGDELYFVSYDGEYPSLCKGKLVMNLNGTNLEFPLYCLESGGECYFDEEMCDTVTEGEWHIYEWPKGFPIHLQERATELVNENVPWGCCGGCI